MNDRIMQWNITKNRKILIDYEKLKIKKLKNEIYESGTDKILVARNYSKLIYLCTSEYDDIFYYDVFINFVIPIPIKFLFISIYDYQEIYPIEQEYGYRAWKFLTLKEAFEKFDSLK